MCVAVRERRYSGCSVSGSRTKPQLATAAAKTANTTKMYRQGAAMRISCPRLGARIGTIRNTTKVRDITRAICRPEYRSRTTERTTDAGGRDAMDEAPRQQLLEGGAETA